MADAYYKPCKEFDICNELIEKYWETMLNYCVPVGAHIIDKVFFVRGQANYFKGAG